MVARQTLTLFVRVRILLPQPSRGVAQLGRALRSGRRGRWFESSHLDHTYKKPPDSESGCFLFYRVGKRELEAFI